jgi:TonB-linked SusC/RagA family outer membrane protein
MEIPDTAVLVVSYVGYQTKEVAVSSQTTVHIVLSSSATELNQVVVIGYGTQKKRDLTGSITVIDGDDIAKMPNSNPVSSLQGKVAGMTVVNSGQAGTAPTVRIRGVNSTNNADPLYVVDGILQTNIDYLNPADIASIEVLKDPSSIAIYGLQGGNGVIIITTKQAKQGQTRISFQSNISLQHVYHTIDLTDAAGFKKLYNQQLENVGASPFDFTNYTANTNWQDLILRTAVQSNNSLSISNSTDKSSTYLNLGYSNQQGVVKYDQYEKYIVRLKEEIHVSDAVRVGGEVTGYHYKQNPPAGIGNLMNKATWAAPVAPVKANDTLYYDMPSFQSTQVGNPLAIIEGDRGHHINQGYRVIGDVFGEVKFLKNFTWKSTFYAELSFDQNRGYGPLPFHYIDLGEGDKPTDTSYNTDINTSVSQSHTLNKTFQQDHTLTYDKDFAGGHHITAMLGFSTLYHYNEQINANRTDTTLNVPDNPMFWYLSVIQGSNPTTLNNDPNANYQGEDASASFMARVNYSYKGKYLVNLTYRRDGTSKFSPHYQWGNFGSAGVGWVMTDEPFMQDISWLNFLKLKASWGTVGNGLNIGNYLSYPRLQTANVGIFGQNVYPAVEAKYIPDPDLHWETVEGKDAGFESRLFNNRFSLDVDFYDRKTHDILTTITLPGAAGETNYFTNLGTIDNKGIEVAAGWNDRIGAFSYSIGGNFSINKNDVESIGNNISFQITGNGGVNMTQTGYSIGYFYGYIQTGIFQSEDEIAKTPHLANAKPGDIIFKDINGTDDQGNLTGKPDGKITPADRTYLGTPFPKYNYGGNISLGYKNFDFGLILQGVAGNKIYVQRRTATFAPVNYESNRLKAWTGPGTSNTEPILDNTRSNNYLFSDYWLEPGDYLRLRMVQLGYTFHPNIMKGNGSQILRLYISGQNLATFTKATGYSPEVPVSNPVSAGADNGVYPVPAIYTFGLNLSF